MDNNGQITKEEEILHNDSKIEEESLLNDEKIDDNLQADTDNVNESTVISKILKGLLLFLISMIIIIGGVLLGMKGYEYFEAQSQKKDIPLDTVVEKENENNEVVKKSFDEIYNDVHIMANTLIVAEDGFIWGTNPINKETLKTAILLVEGMDEYLFGELSKWTSLEFDNAVEVHNYVWKKLGGTVGKAMNLNNEGIERAREALAQ